MTFLDTCIWIELLAVRSPEKEHEIMQAQAATELLKELSKMQEKIVTCKEQLLELISAIEKVRMKTVNSERKENKQKGVGKLKEFRKLLEFQDTKDFCKDVIEDIRYFATMIDIGEYDFDSVLQKMNIVDINDCLYYDFCVRERIKLYTFDSDLGNLEGNEIVYIYDTQSLSWKSL